MNGITFSVAFDLAKPNQYIKAIGDSFRSIVGYYIKGENKTLTWTNGACGTDLKREEIERMKNIKNPIYGVYENQTEFSRIY